MTSLYTLQDSAVVQAGAGTGKTHSLVTLCLHLLGGVGRGGGEPLQPSRLWAVTFTEKAAAELQARLRARVDQLAESTAPGPELEPELWESGGGALPPPEVWQRVRRDLGLAQIGTIHSLCAQLIRRNAAAAGVDPQFALLDELEAGVLLREACEGAILEALDGGALEPGARRLCAEFGYRGDGRHTFGLAGELQKLLHAVGESGVDPVALVEHTSGLDAGAAGNALVAARSAFLQSLDGLDVCARAAGLRNLTPPQQRAAAAVTAFRAEGEALLRAAPPGQLAQAWPGLRLLTRQLPRTSKTLMGECVRDIGERLEALLEADAQLRQCALARDLASLAARAIARFRERKSQRAALDFDDLTRLARDLLARDPAVRRLEKARIGALLVDEFQDTSRAQLALLGWLAEGTAAEGSAPAGSGFPGALPVARGLFVAVGDRKQSIYEFRGADLASARAFSERALADGARLHLLRDSRRSRPALVAFCNLLFSRVLGAGGAPFDAPFLSGEDDLRAVRPEGQPGPCAELLDVPGSVDDEAEAVARRIASLLSPDAPGGPARGGDIAVLLRAFTHLEAYRRALLRKRIPHLVFKGRGFHEAREVQDLIALLTLAADRDDAAALATVLRSPLGPVSDDGLVLLARGPRRGRDGAAAVGHGLDRRALLDESALAALAPDDAEAARRIGRLLLQLQREAGRLGPAALLEGALAESDYRAAIAAGLFGEQGVANVDKLVGLARAHELRGGGLRGFLARLRAAEDERVGEPDAPVVEETDPHAVRLLTVHAAKGLEFPIVFVPECGGPQQGLRGSLFLEPDLGLALKVRGADGAWRWGAQGNQVRARKEQREAAQSRRLLYVAATRARERVVFSGRPAPRNGECWKRALDELAGQPEAAPLLRVFPSATLPTTPSASGRAACDGNEPFLAGPRSSSPTGAGSSLPAPQAAGSSLPAPQAWAAGTLVAPVTQLADACACPERYHLLHEAGLEERPGSPAPLAQILRDPEADEGPARATEEGTLAHRLLELAPLSPGAPPTREQLAHLLTEEGEDPAAHPEVLDVVQAFLAGPLGERMRRAAPGRLLREEPFALHLAPRPGEQPGPALVVRGQLDALLLDSETATVIDFKHAEQRDPERYAAQLDAYALATHQLIDGALPVQTGLVFLRSPGTPFAIRPAAPEAEREATRLRLLAAAREIAGGRRTGRWTRVALSRCKELGCGFQRLCHPEPRQI